MDVDVLLSSGDEDDWEDVGDALAIDGELFILAHLEEEEIPGSMKTFDVSQRIPQQGTDDMVKTTRYRLVAQYAAGMWMKVEYR